MRADLGKCVLFIWSKFLKIPVKKNKNFLHRYFLRILLFAFVFTMGSVAICNGEIRSFGRSLGRSIGNLDIDSDTGVDIQI